MKSDFQLDLSKQDGKFRLELMELLIRHYDFIIFDDTCFVNIKEEDYKEFNIEIYSAVRSYLFDLIAGESNIILEIQNFKRTYDLLAPFIEEKLRLFNIISDFEERYETVLSKSTHGGEYYEN